MLHSAYIRELTLQSSSGSVLHYSYYDYMDAFELESEEQVSPTDSVGSVNHDPTDLFQDAQDPYGGHDLDSI